MTERRNNESHLKHAERLANALNEAMTHLPGWRVQSAGTRVEVRNAHGHFHDPGLDAVSEFHGAFNIAQPLEPSIPDEPVHLALRMFQMRAAELAEGLKEQSAEAGGSGLLIRLQLIQEELAELAAGMINRDRTEVLDALVDLSYVVDGTYLSLGFGHFKLAGLAEVHGSNMSKLDGDGQPIISAAGRVVKSDQYRPPDLASVLGPFAGVEGGS